MSSTGAPRHDLHGLRNRAVRLLEDFFSLDGERERKMLFEHALGGLSPNPCRSIEFSGAVKTFAAHAVDRLLEFGGADRGRHALSLLLATMQVSRGRQSGPDYCDLQREFDSRCALPTRDEELRYLDRLVSETGKLARLYAPLHGIAQTRPARQQAESALLSLWDDDPGLTLLSHRAPRRDTAAQEPAQLRPYDDILSAFADVPRAALLGAPGSGKSTTLRRLALDLATRAQQDSSAPLPLLAGLGKWTGDEPLADFLATHAPEIGWAAQSLSKANRLVLLLDGLNEVPTATRADKAAAVRQLQQQLNRATAIIVSCRDKDYDGDLALGLDTLTLEPLSPRRILAAVRQWVTLGGQPLDLADRFFWQLAGDESRAARQKDRLSVCATEAAEDTFWTGFYSNPRSLIRLASNPFMLTMLFRVWVEEHQALPRNRGELFGRFIEGLLNREGLVRGHASSQRLLAGLAALAWRMQRERIGAGKDNSGDFGVLTVVPRTTAVEALGDEALLKNALDATLLEGDGELRFRHQLLQEYFTAQALQARLDDTDPTDLWPPDRWWQRSGWEEAAVLLAGFQPDDCSRVIRWLAHAQPESAARCILESGAELADRPGLLGELQAAWLPRLCDPQREPQPEGRAAIGRALAILGLDTRPGVGLTVDGVPEIDWVEIPAGEFIYQKGERRQNERFFIARYPVTNAQYQSFLDAGGGYGLDRLWEGFENPVRQPTALQRSESNHPRKMVSWREAMAFCGWLGHALHCDVRLPTEWQWERTARGTDGRPYPWGDRYRDGYANIDEPPHNGPHYLQRTSAVGLYPQGASPEGVLDLSGNVWEWCLNEYQTPDRAQAGSMESRVVRGGSWNDDRDFARAQNRAYYIPFNRNYDIGFRVVSLSPIR